jgi:hypothetical protein
VYGWQDLVSRRYPEPVGRRWLGNCDVPDLELFPTRYPGVDTVRFRAGVGFASSRIVTWGLSWMVRARAVSSLKPYASRLLALARRMEHYGTPWSAMHVQLAGVGVDGHPLKLTWYLLAGSGHGPNIPCLPAIALARKLLRNEISVRGAIPCMGLLSPEEILGTIPGMDLHVRELRE